MSEEAKGTFDVINNIINMSNLENEYQDKDNKSNLIDSLKYIDVKTNSYFQLLNNIKLVNLKSIINAPAKNMEGMSRVPYKSCLNVNSLDKIINLSVFSEPPLTSNLFAAYNEKKNELLQGLQRQKQNSFENPQANQKFNYSKPNYQYKPYTGTTSSSSYMDVKNVYMKKKNRGSEEEEEEENDGRPNYANSIYNINRKKKKNNNRKRRYYDEEEPEEDDEYGEEEKNRAGGFQSALTITNAVLKNNKVATGKYLNQNKSNAEELQQGCSTYSNGGGGGGGYRKFVPPVRKDNSTAGKSSLYKPTNKPEDKGQELDEKLKGFDPKMIEFIESEILTTSPNVHWNDIAGLEFAKKTITEIIIWPLLRPDVFNGIRRPPKGLLLFGPPGTGKTMIAKAIASQSNSRFFNISASSLMSKWVGESEKLVRTLFALASFYQPSVVFIDEIDSILTSRSENECESSRRIKTEFLVQLDGAGTNAEDRILIIGATNRPQEIDDAFIRRLSKRLYIPLPNKESRRQLIKNVLKKETEKNNKYDMNDEDVECIVNMTKGYSGSDMINVCREAAMMPIRSIEDISNLQLEHLRGVNRQDFITSVENVKPSVSDKTIGQYIEWNKEFGSFQFEEKPE